MRKHFFGGRQPQPSRAIDPIWYFGLHIDQEPYVLTTGQPRVTTAEEAAFSGLPEHGILLPLHANIDGRERQLQQQEPVTRARYMTSLLLADWITFGQRMRDDYYASAEGYRGVSPLVQPWILRKLGATVRPAILDAESIQRIDQQHQDVTGKSFESRMVHEFFIGDQAMIEGLPDAVAMLAKFVPKKT